MAEERQVREDQVRCAEAAVSGIRSILTGAQFYRLRQYCIEGKTESEIAEAEGVTQQKVGRAYKIPKVCVIEYLMGEDMCRINLS